MIKSEYCHVAVLAALQPLPSPCQQHEADDAQGPHVCFQRVGIPQDLRNRNSTGDGAKDSRILGAPYLFLAWKTPRARVKLAFFLLRDFRASGAT